MEGLVREFRGLTIQLLAEAGDKERQRTPEFLRLVATWDDKLMEIVRTPYCWLMEQQQGRDARPASSARSTADARLDFSSHAKEVVSSLEQIAEYRTAADRVGNRKYEDSRRNAVAKLTGFAQAIVMGLRNRVR